MKQAVNRQDRDARRFQTDKAHELVTIELPAPIGGCLTSRFLAEEPRYFVPMVSVCNDHRFRPQQFLNSSDPSGVCDTPQLVCFAVKIQCLHLCRTSGYAIQQPFYF